MWYSKGKRQDSVISYQPNAFLVSVAGGFQCKCLVLHITGEAGTSQGCQRDLVHLHLDTIDSVTSVCILQSAASQSFSQWLVKAYLIALNIKMWKIVYLRSFSIPAN